MEDELSTDGGGWFQDDSSIVHSSCALFLLLHQLHLRPWGTRCPSLGTPALHIFPFLCPLGTGRQEENKHFWRQRPGSWWWESWRDAKPTVPQKKQMSPKPGPRTYRNYPWEKTILSIDLKIKWAGSLLGVQWWGICLPTQETQVQSLMQEDHICQRATKPVCHNYWAVLYSPGAATPEARVPKACALQQETPLQWEARAWQLDRKPMQQQRPSTAKNK